MALLNIFAKDQSNSYHSVNKHPKLNEHVLIPAVLIFANISLVMIVYFLYLWQLKQQLAGLELFTLILISGLFILQIASLKLKGQRFSISVVLLSFAVILNFFSEGSLFFF